MAASHILIRPVAQACGRTVALQAPAAPAHTEPSAVAARHPRWPTRRARDKTTTARPLHMISQRHEGSQHTGTCRSQGTQRPITQNEKGKREKGSAYQTPQIIPLFLRRRLCHSVEETMAAPAQDAAAATAAAGAAAAQEHADANGPDTHAVFRLQRDETNADATQARCKHRQEVCADSIPTATVTQTRHGAPARDTDERS